MSQSTREEWKPLEKETIKKLLQKDTMAYKILHGSAKTSVKYKVWQEVIKDWCALTVRESVNHQKLRDMWKKEVAKVNKQNRAEYDKFVQSGHK